MWPIRQLTILSTVTKRELKSCIAACSSTWCADVKRRSKREDAVQLNHSRGFQWLIWSDGLCGFIYSSNLHAIMNKCLAGISLILKSKAAGIHAQSHTAIQDLIKQNSIAHRIVKHDFSKTFWIYLCFQNFTSLEIAVLKSHDFSRFSWPDEPECDDRVLLSKSDKNIGAGGWIIYLKLRIRVTFYFIHASLTISDIKWTLIVKCASCFANFLYCI